MVVGVRGFFVWGVPLPPTPPPPPHATINGAPRLCTPRPTRKRLRAAQAPPPPPHPLRPPHRRGAPARRASATPAPRNSLGGGATDPALGVASPAPPQTAPPPHRPLPVGPPQQRPPPHLTKRTSPPVPAQVPPPPPAQRRPPARRFFFGVPRFCPPVGRDSASYRISL